MQNEQEIIDTEYLQINLNIRFALPVNFKLNKMNQMISVELW